MKTFVRFGSLVLVLGLAGFLAGCASSHRQVVQRPQLARDFEVVETSTKRTLNPQEMAVLRAKVADYLEKQGATASGDYYVKVFLGADQEGVPAEWVVVRFTRDSDLRFSLLASYPTYSTSANSYAAYDYYPYGYDNFGRISFQYYDDPYYGSRYYFPPARRHDRDNDRDKDGHHDRGNDGKDRDHDKDGNRNGDTARTQDPRVFKPSAPAPTPQVTRTRWDGDASGQNNNRSRDNNQPRDNNNNYPHHGGAPAGRQQTGGSSGSSYTPPIRTSSESAPRTDSYRSEPSRSESFRTSSQSAPSYNSAPVRSESSQPSSSNETHRESNRSAALNEKSE